MSNITHTSVDVSADLHYSAQVPKDGAVAFLYVGNLQLVFWGDAVTQIAAVDRLCEALGKLRDGIDQRAVDRRAVPA